MTHTLYRQGRYDELKNDFVLLAMCATGITHRGSAGVKKELFELLQQFPHANAGEVKTGSVFNAKLADILEGFVDTSVLHYVYVDKPTLVDVLEAVRKADLGISVVISGVFDEVNACLNKVGLKPHTVEHSGGIWGKTDRLPPQNVLNITTMCGHGLVSGNLVLDTVKKVKRGKLTLAEAGARLAQPCICGIFNPKQAEHFIEQLM